jgi:hypothetical protein
MERFAIQEFPKPQGEPSLDSRAAAGLRFILGLPFRLVWTVIARAVQVLLALFIVVLHPHAKWLLNLIVESSFVQKYIRPSLQSFLTTFYEPYFAYLRGLPPYWATFSIALPLAILEPAKLYATILIAERPKMGILLWLFFQALSFVLIDKTWSAVRFQSRKVWLVSRLHAWGRLNVSYGKYWIENSSLYRAAMRWNKRLRRKARVLLPRLARP